LEVVEVVGGIYGILGANRAHSFVHWLFWKTHYNSVKRNTL